jgi:hyperosmotically inducible protein
MRALAVMFGVLVVANGCNPIDTSPAPKVADQKAAAPQTATAPDNTAVNKRDVAADTKTPLDQKENQADVNLTAKIRQRVLDEKDLSVDVRNAKIITADGKVTLRGPVSSSEERETLARIALEVAGEGNVDNQLEVAGTKEARR